MLNNKWRVLPIKASVALMSSRGLMIKHLVEIFDSLELNCPRIAVGWVVMQRLEEKEKKKSTALIQGIEQASE